MDLGTRCWSSSEMEGWVGWLAFVLTGVCWICCLWGFGDVCCVGVGILGWCCGCTNGCGGVYEEGASEELVDAAGVLCPQGSELWGEDSVLLSVELGWKMDVGLGAALDVEGERFVGWGYIAGHRSCLSIRSASPVTLSIIVLVSYSSGKSLMSSYAVRSSMTGKSSRVL